MGQNHSKIKLFLFIFFPSGGWKHNTTWLHPHRYRVKTASANFFEWAIKPSLKLTFSIAPWEQCIGNFTTKPQQGRKTAAEDRGKFLTIISVIYQIFRLRSRNTKTAPMYVGRPLLVVQRSRFFWSAWRCSPARLLAATLPAGGSLSEHCANRAKKRNRSPPTVQSKLSQEDIDEITNLFNTYIECRMGIKLHLSPFISYILPRAMNLLLACSSFSLGLPNLVLFFVFSLVLYFICDWKI